MGDLWVTYGIGREMTGRKKGVTGAGKGGNGDEKRNRHIFLLHI